MKKINKILPKIIMNLKEAYKTKRTLYLRNAKDICNIANIILSALKANRYIYLLGNGGSAADAQHIAGELQGKFFKNRRPLAVSSLTTNTSTLTAVGNDYGFEYTFSRQVEAMVKKGDVVIAISTSGNSPNVIKAVESANRLGAKTIGLTGRKGGKLKNKVSLCLCVPSSNVARIQECHITIGHILCQVVESTLFE
jgi:D-sedoheptulose 7-phosphate isomerase